MGGCEQGTDGRQHQHDHAAGTARRQGPAAARGPAQRPAGPLCIAEGLAQLSLPLAAHAGAGRECVAVRGAAARGARDARRMGEGDERRLAQRPRRAAAPRCVGRDCGRGRPVHTSQVQPLRCLLRVQGTSTCRDGGCGGGEPLAAAGRHRRASRVAELGRGGSAARLLASGGGRGPSPGRRRRQSPGQQRVEPRGVQTAQPIGATWRS